MNKYHNGKASGGKGPTPGNSGVKPRPGKESTAAWKTNIGPVGPRRNTVGFKEVKVSVKQRMSDDGVPLIMQGEVLPQNIMSSPGGPTLPGLSPEAMDAPGAIISRPPVGDPMPNIIDNTRRPVGDPMPNIFSPPTPARQMPWQRIVERRRARQGR